MPGIPIEQRTIEELVTRYTLHPEFRDIYVEGSSDQTVVEWFLGRNGINDVVVYSIDTVVVPSTEVQLRGLENNNRGRVICLSEVFGERIGQVVGSVLCVADTDFDAILRIRRESEVLALTDFTSMELYLFDARVVQKFLQLVLGGFPFAAAEVLDALEPVLCELFRYRAANLLLALGLEQLEFTRCCTVSGRTVRLAADDYLTRYLNKSGVRDRIEEFMRTAAEVRIESVPDRRQRMHGHDFVRLLGWYIRAHSSERAFWRPELLARALVACLEPEWLAPHGLFSRLLTVFSR